MSRTLPPRAPRTPAGRLLRWARGPLAHAFRVTPESREALVNQMLTRQLRDAAMYWLQLVLAMAIATLGLALGSSTVVIGAMLISPLMTPIVELGMGLAVGSPVLVVRAFGQVVASVGVVVVSAAAITLALPFHEITAPIAARASPTALDLLIAVCCALMAAFATLTARSASTTMAAGTAVGIALVPPLCVVGFGLGTRQLEIARGASLLFTASFSAIMLFAVLTFTAFGFGELDVAALERQALPAATRSPALVRTERLLGGWSGGLFRLVLPLLLLALVYIPLRSALEEVAWEVRARHAVGLELQALSKDTVRSSLTVAGHHVRVQLVVLGTPERARRLERRLTKRISEVTGTLPTVDVAAVPDAESMREALAAKSAPAPELLPAPTLPSVPSRVASVLESRWPADAAGALVAWRLDRGPGAATLVEAVHFGDALGPAAVEVLGRELSDAAGESVHVDDVVLPREPVSAAPQDGAAWLARVTPLLDAVARFEGLYACVGVPRLASADAGPDAAPGDAGVATRAGSSDAVAAVRSEAAALGGGRAQLVEDGAWRLRVQMEPCASEAASEAPADAGVRDAASADAR